VPVAHTGSLQDAVASIGQRRAITLWRRRGPRSRKRRGSGPTRFPRCPTCGTVDGAQARPVPRFPHFAAPRLVARRAALWNVLHALPASATGSRAARLDAAAAGSGDDPAANFPKGSRRPSDTRAPKRESRGTRSARVAAARTRNISFLAVSSRPQANPPRRPLVATGSPSMPATGESRGPVAFGRESRWIPASCRTGEGGGPGTNRCRDRGRIAEPGSAVHVPSPSVPGEGWARAPQSGNSRDLPLERDTGGTPFAGVGLGRAANEAQFGRSLGSVPAILPATAGGRPWPATG
jgi:hypothetical protein